MLSKEVDTQFATSMSSDFEENTWTFLMPENFQVWAGQFAIVDKSVYDRHEQERKELVQQTNKMREALEKIAETDTVSQYIQNLIKEALK